MTPRPFQAALLDKTRAAIRAGARRILLQLPTGGGKTFIAALIMRGMIERGLRPSFGVHRKELLDQTSETFNALGIPHGFIARQHALQTDIAAQLLSIQYAARRVDQLQIPDAFLIDEAHHSVAAQYLALLEAWEVLQIGLTATPERLDGRGLSDRFDVMVKGPSVAQLIADGFLSPYRYFAPGRPDLAGIRSRGGDYARNDLSEIMGNADLIGDVVDHYHEFARNEQGIVFGVDRKHSQSIADGFTRAGVACAHVDGTMNDRERAGIIGAFRAGEIKIMCNVDLFGEGFDVPGLVYVGLCRPTKSLALFMQQVGRGLRTMEGKEAAIICDHAGNAFTHGLPDDERQWTLEGRIKGKSRGPSDAPAIHQCPMCYQVTPSQLRNCPCGYVFPLRDRNPAWEEGQLFEFTKAEQAALEKNSAAARRKAEEKACKSYSDLYDLALARGYQKPQGWAKSRWKMRKGFRPNGRRWKGRR